MEDRGLLLWKISGLAILLRVHTPIAAIQPGSFVVLQMSCRILFLINLSLFAPAHFQGVV